MKIDIRTNKVVYVTIGQWTYYIDDSTNEQIVRVFANNQLYFKRQKPKSHDRDYDRNPNKI